MFDPVSVSGEIFGSYVAFAVCLVGKCSYVFMTQKRKESEKTSSQAPSYVRRLQPKTMTH